MSAPIGPSPAIICLGAASLEPARRLAGEFGGVVHGLAGRAEGAEIVFDGTAEHLRALFAEGRPILAFMAAGALIRILAPLLVDKRAEPPILAISEDGASIVPLLGGHHGANEMARRGAEILAGHAAITTAGDTRFGVALDEPPPGYTLENPDAAKDAMAALLAGATARLEGEAPWISASALPHAPSGTVCLRVDDGARPPSDGELLFRPRNLVLGMGCERGALAEEAISLAEQVLEEAGLSPASLAAVASLDLKADEAAIHAVAAHFGVRARFFTAATLESERDRLENPSDIVFAEVGCHGVAEGAALAGAGPDGVLALPKRKTKRVTAALGRAPRPLDPATMGRARGQLFVVGIGPGQSEWRSPEASRMIGQASDLVGYSLYLDLLGPLADGKIRHDFDLGKEEARVRHAMELAGEGRDVALVCSGDAGIYAMATLVFELLERGDLSPAASRIAIAVAPGISALQAAAARIGAPLGHDFCTISLSDLLTPWEDIERRVKAAAAGDFVIAFYNPVSRRRRTQLAHARDVLLAHRPPDTPVVLATDLGRPDERVRIVSLKDLSVDEVDMLTVVLVGSSNSRVVSTGEGRRFVYTPRGYERKEGTGIRAGGETQRSIA